jgi:hypothetical protein
MSLFKFHDSNYLNVSNRPEISATTTTYNGEQFKLVGDTAVPHATATEVQAGDAYVMLNIIDKPEIKNTDDYCVKSGERIRAYRLKDIVGLQLDLSADLVTDAFSTVTTGAFLVGRSIADTTDTMGWKVVADVTGYEVYLKVERKTTFGSFTVDKNNGTVAGGYLVTVKSTN